MRLFAAARAAAGTDSVEIEPGPVGPGLAAMGLGADFERVLSVCTLMRDGDRLAPGDVVADGDVVDVLPPFAGG